MGIEAGAVVVATPAFAAAPLVAPHAPRRGKVLGGIEHASVALVGLAVPREAVDRAARRVGATSCPGPRGGS